MPTRTPTPTRPVGPGPAAVPPPAGPATRARPDGHQHRPGQRTALASPVGVRAARVVPNPGRPAGRDEALPPLPPLTPAEVKVAVLVAAGHTSAQAAARLGCEPRTVDTHVNRILHKRQLTRRRQLAQHLRSDPQLSHLLVRELTLPAGAEGEGRIVSSAAAADPAGLDAVPPQHPPPATGTMGTQATGAEATGMGPENSDPAVAEPADRTQAGRTQAKVEDSGVAGASETARDHDRDRRQRSPVPSAAPGYDRLSRCGHRGRRHGWSAGRGWPPPRHCDPVAGPAGRLPAPGRCARAPPEARAAIAGPRRSGAGRHRPSRREKSAMDTTMPVADPGVRARRRYAIAATTLFAACAAVAYVDGPRPGLVVASALLSAAATVPYLVATLRGQVKPRLVTWGTWCMLTAMAALASASDGDHPATAYALVGTIATGAVVAVGWRHGDRDFGRIDIACLLLVVVGVVAWQLLEMPAAAVLIACLIEAVGLVPAVVHAWRAPREGTPATYALLGAGGLAAVAAAWGDWTVTAVAYPACIAASMALVVAIAARPALRPSIGEHPGNSLGLDRAALAHGRPGTAPGDVEPARDDLVGAWAGGDGATDDDQRDDDQRDDDQRDDELSEHDEVTDDEPFVDTVAGGTRRVLARTGSPRTASRPLPSRPATPAPPPGHGVIEARRLTVLGWVRRYGPAYGAGIVAAPSAAHLVAPAGHLVTTATAFTAEFVAFYGVLVWGDLRAARRWGGPAPRVVLRRLVTECGPAELLDLVLRPVLMYLAIAATAAAVGSLIGALSCDLVYWTLVTIGYHVARATPGRHRAGRAQPSHQPASPARPTVVTGPPASRPESRPRVVAVATRPRTTARARPTRQPADPAPAAAVGPTPYLLLDPARVRCAYQRLRRSLACLDGLHYAVKANPDPAVLAALHEQGCGFEVASPAELAALAAVGVDPRDVLYSHPVKPVAHIAAAHEMGCWRLAADSVGELDKIARHAPHAAVYIRLRPPRAGGAVGSEGKFGVGADTAVALLRRAADLGLDPHGLTFHVGSQATEATSWADAIRATAPVLDQLREQGIRLAMLDIGGGFPVEYPGTAVDLDLVDAHIRAAVAELPYRPRRVVAEPGRALVADAGTLVSTVIGTATRAGTHFAHLDTGAFHGLIEALESHNTLRFPMRDSRAAPLRRRYTVTGPSCDSQDTIGHNVALSADLGPGDIVHIGMAGAYTTSYTTAFNGFDVPRVVVADPMADSVLATADPATADAATAGTAAGPAGRDGAVEVAVPA